MFLTIGLLLPFLTGQMKQIGNMLLPMHIPVLLCGLICGGRYGLGVGVVLPLLRSVLFGMPVFFPNAAAMAFELAAYGAVAGFLYGRSKWKCVIALYRSMIAAMLGGRLIWGLVMILFLGVGDGGFTWEAFMAGAFLQSFPGILLQLVLIPAVMVALNRAGLVKFSRKKPREEKTALS